MTEGIIYIITDERYREEAKKSVKQLKKHNDYPVTFITDQRFDLDILDKQIILEDEIEGSAKVQLLEKTPYDKTLYLDTDTFVTDNITELFTLLEKYDIAFAHNPERASEEIQGVPDSFPEPNTGVIPYKKTDNVVQLFENWQKEYKNRNYNSHRDQPAFRKALYNTKVNFTILPSEYNCRFGLPGFLDEKAKILHGRLDNYEGIGLRYTCKPEKALKTINSVKGARSHYFKRNKVVLKRNNPAIWDKVYSALKWYGAKETLRKMKRRMF